MLQIGEERTQSTRDMLEEVISECTTAWKRAPLRQDTWERQSHPRPPCQRSMHWKQKVLNKRSKKTENPYDVLFFLLFFLLKADLPKTKNICVNSYVLLVILQNGALAF